MIAIVLTATLAGCNSTLTHIGGVEPVQPVVNMLPETITTNRPTMEWKPSEGENITYDLIVFPFTTTNRSLQCTEDGRAVAQRAEWEFRRTIDGKLNPMGIRYLKGLTQTRYVIDQPLKPDTQYAWSVRIRRGEKAGSWSTYTGHRFETSHVNPINTTGNILVSPIIFFGGVIGAYTPGATAEGVGRILMLSARPYGEVLGFASTKIEHAGMPFRFLTPKQ